VLEQMPNIMFRFSSPSLQRPVVRVGPRVVWIAQSGLLECYLLG
jgi:hypothetical protein